MSFVELRLDNHRLEEAIRSLSCDKIIVQKGLEVRTSFSQSSQSSFPLIALPH
jgi:hypothetical protein